MTILSSLIASLLTLLLLMRKLFASQSEDIYCNNDVIIQKTLLEARWSPDGSKLAVSSFEVDVEGCYANAKLQILDGTTKALLTNLEVEPNRPIYAIAWRPDGNLLATGHSNGGIRFWNPTIGELLADYPVSELPLSSIYWSPDSSKLASSGLDNTIRIIDAATGQIVTASSLGTPQYPGLSGSITFLACNYEQDLIASGAVDGVVRIWNPDNLQLTKSLEGHKNTIEVGSWNPDGTRLATGGFDGLIRIWDMNSGQMILRGHTKYMTNIRWSPDGTQIISSNTDATLRIWDAAIGQQIALIQPENMYEIATVDWSSTGKIAYGGSIAISNWIYHDDDGSMELLTKEDVSKIQPPLEIISSLL